MGCEGSIALDDLLAHLKRPLVLQLSGVLAVGQLAGQLPLHQREGLSGSGH